MTIDQLHQLHMQKLTRAFGVGPTMSVVLDDRSARAFGSHPNYGD